MRRLLARRLALAAALLGAAAARAAAADVVAALTSDSVHYRQAFEGFEEEWGSSVPVVSPGRAGGAKTVVAFGSRAALRAWPDDALLVTCLAPGARPARAGETLRVELLPSPAVLVARMKGLLPRLKVLRVLWSSEFERQEVDELAAEAARLGVSVISERVEEPDDLPERLRAIDDRADALWLMPDPALVSAENFAVIREYAAVRRVPFLAPTEGLAEKGATATLAASFRDVGRAAALALRSRRSGQGAHGLAHPDRIVVTVNEAAARATGLELGAARGVDRVVR